MSSEKKFRIQNGLDVAGEVLVNGINIVGADGVLNQASYQTAVQAMIDATVAQGVDQNSIDTAVSTAVAALADSAPETLDTLNELAAALGDDADFATSMTNALNTKLNAANNLSDVADAAAARSNLGLGTAATAATTSFATAAQGVKADSAAQQADLDALAASINVGTKDFTVNGAITAGQPVTLLSNGEVSFVAASSINESSITNPLFPALNLPSGGIASANDMMAFEHVEGNTYITAWKSHDYRIYVGLVTSDGTSLTWQTPTEFYSGNGTEPLAFTWNSYSSVGAVIYREGWQSTQAKVRSFTLSGTSVVAGTEIALTSSQKIYNSVSLISIPDGSIVGFYSGQYNQNNNDYLFVMDSSGSITHTTGSAAGASANAHNAALVYDPQYDILHLAKLKGDTGTVRIVTMPWNSGAPSMGEALGNSNGGYYNDLGQYDNQIYGYGYNPVTQKALMVFKMSGSTRIVSLDQTGQITVEHGHSRTMPGNNQSNIFWINSDGTVSLAHLELAPDDSIGTKQRFGWLTYTEGNNGLAIDVPTDTYFTNIPNNFYNQGGDYRMRVGTNPNGGLIALIDPLDNQGTNLNNVECEVIIETVLTPSASNFIGISNATVTSATAEIVIAGGLSTNHTGLSVGSSYYVQSDGSLSTTTSSIKAGTAIDATTILVSDHLSDSTDLSDYATKAYADSAVAGVDLTNYTNTVNMNTAISTAVSDISSSDLDMGGNKVLFGNLYSNLADLPDASTYHGMFAHVHATGKGYFAHAGNWVELANSSDLLTQSDIDTAVSNLVDSAPEALNTLNELAAALGDDANFASTVTTSLASKADDAATTAALATKADASAVATAAQGALADTAVQPEDFGTGISTTSVTTVDPSSVESITNVSSNGERNSSIQNESGLYHAVLGNGHGEFVHFNETEFIVYLQDSNSYNFNMNNLGVSNHQNGQFEPETFAIDSTSVWWANVGQGASAGNVYVYKMSLTDASVQVFNVGSELAGPEHVSLVQAHAVDGFYYLGGRTNVGAWNAKVLKIDGSGNVVSTHTGAGGQTANLIPLSNEQGHVDATGGILITTGGGQPPNQIFAEDLSNPGTFLWTLHTNSFGLGNNFARKLGHMWHSDKYVVVQNRRDPNKDHNENQYSQLKVIDRNTGAIVSTVLNQYGSHDWNFGNSVVVIGDYVIVGAAGDQNPTQNVTGTGGSFKNSVYSALDGSFLYDIDSTERLNLVHKNSDTVNATVQITTTTRKEIEVKFNSQVDVTISADTDVMATRAFAESAVAGVDLTNYSNTTAMNTAIATAKSEAISAAATDATTKADAAEAAAISAANTAVANAIDAAPDSLNTLNELAAALGDDANFASTMTTALAGKADASALADKADASAVATSAQGALADTAVQPEDFGTGITLGAGVSDWASAELSSPINIGTQYNVGWTSQPIATSESYFVTGSRGSASNGSIDLLVWSKSDTSSPYRDLSSALPANAYNTLYLEMTDEYVFISFNTNNGNGDTGVLMIKISDLTVVDIKSIATSGGASWTTGGQGHGFTFDIDDQYIAMAPRLGSNEAIIVDWVSQQYVRSYAFTDGQDMLSVAVDSGKLLVSSVRDAAAGKYQTTTADLVDIATGSLLHKFTAQQTLQHQVNPNAYGSAYGDIVLMSSQYIAVGSTNGTDPATGYITGAIDIFNASTYAFMGTITQDDGMTNHWANDGIGESGKVDLFGQYLVATKTAPSDVLYVYDLSSATFTTAIKEIALSDKQGGRVVLSSTGAVIMPEHGIKATSDGAMSIVTVPVSTTSPFIVDDTVFATRTFAESAVAGVDLTNYSNTTAMNTAIATAKSEAISAAATDATTKADAAEAAAIAAANTAATTAVADVVDAAPEALNTLNELAAALGDDANFASTVTTSLAAKADSSALDAAVADIATKADTNAVATLAQGALADTAIQPEDLSTGITTASSTSVNIGTLNYEEFDSGSEHGEFINSGAPAIGGNYLYVIDFWNNGNIDNLYRKTIESDGTLSSGFTPWSGNITGYLPDYAQLRNSINKRFAASDDGYLIIGDPLSNNYSGEMFYLKFDDVWMNGAAGSLDLSFGHGGDRVGESVDISSYGYAYTSRTQDDGYYVYVNTRLPNQSSTTGSYRLSGTDLSLIKIGQMGLKVTDDKVIFSSGNGRPTAYQIHNLIDGTYAATINESGDSGWGWRMDTDGTNILITSDNYVYVYDMTGALVTSFVHNISFPYGMGGVTINGDNIIVVANGSGNNSTNVNVDTNIYQFSLSSGSLVNSNSENVDYIYNLQIKDNALAGHFGTTAFSQTVGNGAFYALMASNTTTSYVVDDSVFATKAYVDSGVAGVDLSGYTTTADLTSSDLDLNGNKVLFGNVYSTLADLPSATTYHGMFAHVHATGKGYFAHAGNWVELANTSDLLTQSDIDTAVANLVDTAPDSLNTLNELAAALGDDANFASTMTNSLASKADSATVTAALADKADVTYVNSEIAGLNTTIANINVTGDITSALGSYSTTAQMNTAISTSLSDYSTTTQMNTAISTAVDGLVDSAPGALDTLNELAAALGDDANFASTMTTSLAGKATSAQGALADTALQPEDLSDILSTTTSITMDLNTVDWTWGNWTNAGYIYYEGSSYIQFTSDKMVAFRNYGNGTFDQIEFTNPETGVMFAAPNHKYMGSLDNIGNYDANQMKSRFAASSDNHFIVADPTSNRVWYGNLDSSDPATYEDGSNSFGTRTAVSNGGFAWKENTTHGKIHVRTKAANSSAITSSYAIEGDASNTNIGMFMYLNDTALVYSKGSGQTISYVVRQLSDNSEVEISRPDGAQNWGYNGDVDQNSFATMSNDYIYIYSTTDGSLTATVPHSLSPYPDSIAIDGNNVITSSQSNGMIYHFNVSTGAETSTQVHTETGSVAYVNTNGSNLIVALAGGQGYVASVNGTSSTTTSISLSGQLSDYSTTAQMNTAITTAADAAEADAIATASSDATTKADAAQATAIATASSDATTKANAAEAAAIASANVTSTTKADAAQAAAIAAAATDATTKADAAQAAAIAAAATDATAKANAAQTAAETFATNAATTAVANVIDTAPDSLNTLNELAAALGDDANFASTVTAALADKADSTTVSSVSTVANSALQPADAAGLSVDDADKLDGEHGTHYRINIYDINGTLVN